MGDSEADNFLETRTFRSLDGLRALSISGVIWFHVTNGLPPWWALRRGFLGVDFFFLISGFLIATLNIREMRRTHDLSLRNFYLRRFLRIVPAYWSMLLLAAAVAFVKPGEGSAGIKHDLPFAIFYVSNLLPMASLLSITWSLSAEEQFYFVIPALQKYLPRALPLIVLPLLYLCACLPPFGVLAANWQPSFFRETTFGPILLGVILAYLLDAEKTRRIAVRLLGSKYSPLVAIALVVAALSYPDSDISGWPRLFIHWTLALFLVSCVVRERHVLVPLLTWSPVRRIGAVSYGMYLYHLLAVWPIAKLFGYLHLGSAYLLFVGVFAATWLMAELSYRLIELRFLKLKEKFSDPANVRGWNARAAAAQSS